MWKAGGVELDGRLLCASVALRMQESVCELNKYMRDGTARFDRRAADKQQDHVRSS